jgi:hypothetical protein
MSRIRLLVLAGVVGFVLAAGGAALASWVVTVSSGANAAVASAQTLPTGATPTTTVSPASSQTASISFAQGSTSGGNLVTAYNVNRYAVGSGTSTPISGSCSIVSSTVTCTDAPGAGSWQYTDVPTIASSTWVGTESAESTAVVVQALTSTTVAVAGSGVVNTAITPSATLSGATTSPAPSGSIAFSVFGPQASAPSSCTGAGWSAVGTSVTVTANGSYNASASFSATSAGTYWWEASYSGDTHNAGSSSTCAANSTVVHLAVSPSNLPAATVYAAYSQTVSATGGTSPYTFAVTSGSLPTGLTLSSGGVLSGTISAAAQSGTFNFTVTATDHVGLTGSTAYALTVNVPPITLAALSPANPTGETTWAAVAAASGGQATYSYALSSGALPTGLSLNTATGGFTGTETGPGTFTFAITATDANSYTGSQSYTVTVISPTITVSPASPLPVGIQGITYSGTLSGVGGNGPYTFAVTTGSLPSAVALSSGGVFSGSPGATGTTAFTVTATDAHGFTGFTAYSLKVVPALSASRIGASGTVSCGISLGSCSIHTTSSVTTAASPTTELIVAYFTSSSLLSSVTASASGPFTSVTSVGINPFTSSGGGTSTLFMWTAKGNNSSSTATVTFSGLGLTLSATAAVDVIQLSGNDTTTPVAQSISTGAGNSATASATFGSAPTGGDGSIIFVGTLAASTFTTPAGATAIDVPGTTGLFGLYLFDPATTSQNFTVTSGHWGTIGVEINHG